MFGQPRLGHSFWHIIKFWNFIDKRTLSDEAWKLLNERTKEVEKKGRKMLMPKTGNQHETIDLLDEIDKRLNDDSDFPKTTTTGEEVRLKTMERENDPQRKNAKNESSSSSDLQNSVQVGVNDKLNDVLMKFCTAANSNTKHQNQILDGIVNSIKLIENSQKNYAEELKRTQEKLNDQTKRLKNAISELIQQEVRKLKKNNNGGSSIEDATEKIVCYECNQFTTHKAKDCPQRLARRNSLSRGRGRGSMRGNFYGRFNRNDRRQSFKRKNNDNSEGTGAKKRKLNDKRGRGQFKNQPKQTKRA
ncbi:hypothetical protein KQX54_016371 [Cotesia glomerata]|uniref:CCHC-type domain-containing protein n=1 Tax=Cotesia glomerata TaxID=32391 RepID=A0AAV7J8K8_COTGL|nr:hypothetical protein KQX54_016371 [Cotesia glomerata]